MLALAPNEKCGRLGTDDFNVSGYFEPIPVDRWAGTWAAPTPYRPGVGGEWSRGAALGNLMA